MKKFFSNIVLFAIFMGVIMSVIPFSTDADTSENKKKIDMYLIAGQSNAAGYSPILSSSKKETFSNVWYAGMTEKNFLVDFTGTNTLSSFKDYKRSVTAGLGNSSRTIGPEYGIAKVLNPMYGGETKALIFKTAAGGTSLLDNTKELSARYGNWYPRSLWKKGYTPDISAAYEKHDMTGVLYALFLENFTNVYHTLKANGYLPEVKAMFWMQGETDLGINPDEYKKVIKVFINDMREDLVKITGDESLYNMPFIIGEIAETFAPERGKTYNSYARRFVRMQRTISTEMNDNKVSTVKTADLIIGTGFNQPARGCPDVYHFNFHDQVTLGERFANKYLEISDLPSVNLSATGGKLEYESNADGSLTLLLKPDNLYMLKTLTVNGEDRTADVRDNQYVTSERTVTAHAEFVRKQRFTVSYAEIPEGGRFTDTEEYVYESDNLEVGIEVYDGYEVESVTYAGEAMTYNAETGKYEITARGDGTVEVKLVKKRSGGCTGILGFGSCITVLVTLMLTMAFVSGKTGVRKQGTFSER